MLPFSNVNALVNEPSSELIHLIFFMATCKAKCLGNLCVRILNIGDIVGALIAECSQVNILRSISRILNDQFLDQLAYV